MKLHFLGANRQVTGSRYCLEANGRKFLVDCGLFQEREFLERNWADSPVPPADLAAVLLTHVHIDHSGLLPKLAKEGYRGPIYATRPSVSLADVVLRDAAEIQEEDAAYKKRRHEKEGRRGKYPELPLYTLADAERAIKLFSPVGYGQPLQLAEGIAATFHDAGHILGSAMISVDVNQAGGVRRVLFSGDVGQQNRPLLRNPTLFEQADYVVLESTYGDRDHESAGDVDTQLADVINDTVARGGVVVIPTFAVERAQELIYHLSGLWHRRRIPRMPVFLDSPMAVDVTEIYHRHHDCFDADTIRLMAAGQSPLQFPGLRLARTAEQSKAINRTKPPCIIMATSGMCTSGRIKHHLRQHLDDPASTVLFVGYQGRGTLGRQILEGNSEVRIHGKMVRARARIAQIYGFSGHADRSGLLAWLGSLKSAPRGVFLTHGEPEAAAALAEEIVRRHGWPVTVPQYGSSVDLA